MNNTQRIGRRARAILTGFSLVVLAACARDQEADVRAKLGQWFFLGPTVYFVSQTGCTGAMFDVNLVRPRNTVTIQNTVDQVEDALMTTKIAAVQMGTATPTDLTEFLRLSSARAFGDLALAAGSLARSCLQDDTIRELLFQALNRPGGLLAYDVQGRGLLVLDQVEKRLFYIAGDP